MKKMMLEYLNIIAYTITGLVFGLTFFLLILNFYHYRDINITYKKCNNDKQIEQELITKLNKIDDNIKNVEINKYKGTEDISSLSNINNRLSMCTKSINTLEFQNILLNEKVTIKNVYDMIQFYQDNIANECLIKQLYELFLDEDNKINISNLQTIAPFIRKNIDQLIKAPDYMQKVIKNNSSYMFSSQESKNELYNQTKDSYYALLDNYSQAIDFIYDISLWYKNIVGGDKNEEDA